ncbi:lasso peptide [Rhodothermus marinus]|uniref:lasso peptide n=1 Tax=Rhodothermus marinus TaxID=29549 RepID=UPI0037CAF3FA
MKGETIKRPWQKPALVMHGRAAEVTAGGCWYGKQGGRYDADLGPGTLSDCR